MQIRTKLNLCFAVLVVALALTGFMGIRATQEIHENHLITGKITELLFTQNKMISVTGEAVTSLDLAQLQGLKNKLNAMTQFFHITFRETQGISDEIRGEIEANERNLEKSGNNIFNIHEKKLTQQLEFNLHYPFENEQRGNIREVVFGLELPHLTKKMGDAQYFSKETLYQHRDKKHLDEWLDSIEALKTLLSEVAGAKLPPATKKQVLGELTQYKKTITTMGKIVIDAKEIEMQEIQQIVGLLKIIKKSEDDSLALKSKIVGDAESLMNNILFIQVTIMIITVAFAFLFSAYISRSIGGVILNLKNGVEKIANGDLETQIKVATKDEFSKLAGSFNLMTDELREAKTSLEENNRNLEQKVSDRTEELQSLSFKLSKYLSPQVYESIFSGKKDVKLESYRKKLTVFFSDIQGFTKITDSIESEALSSLLNSYLNEMSEIALKHGGTIDKFIGDAVMVFFGDPETQGVEKDALACVQMSLEMRERMKDLRAMWNDQGISQPLRIRIGVNTGFCTVGNFGSEARLDYTIIGGQVNLASRLESNAEADQILISHETYALIKDKIGCEKKGEITVKGIAHPVQTYQVVEKLEKSAKETKEFKEEFYGFKLSVDLKQIDKELALRTLKKAIEKLD